MDNKIVIAIDGHSACGKSTLAKNLAKELKYIYIDSGAMYRAATLWALRNDFFINDYTEVSPSFIEYLDNVNISFNYNRATGNSDTFLNGLSVEDEIRTMRVSKLVSLISKVKEVREKLVSIQQGFGKNKGIVMDGRDIGTIVFPDAELKLWITASKEVRTARRYKELLEKGYEVSIKDVEENIEKRDLIDTTRKVGPLKKADDAIEIDNSHLSKNETLSKAVSLARAKM